MPSFSVETPQHCYSAVVERGVIGHLAQYIPSKAGKLFVVSTEDVWRHQGEALERGLAGVAYEVLHLPGGEEHKRLAPVEQVAEEMVRRGGDRSSLVVAFGGGIVGDMAGFLAAIFMRGISVLQVPTTLLAQVDAVLIDPAVLATLPEREYRSGLHEIVKAGIIREPDLFRFLADRTREVLARQPQAVDRIIADAVRMKCEVVSSDERDTDLRRILNFGHTFGHALEAETGYTRFLHGEAVAFGMRAAACLGQLTGRLSADDNGEILEMLRLYGPIPPLDGIPPANLLARLVHDKKTVQGKVHFVLPVRIGEVAVVSGIDEMLVLESIRSALS
jgi:3-dehydroquinate synthase